jgi:uncharacterized alkaline shock family protein YloU
MDDNETTHETGPETTHETAVGEHGAGNPGSGLSRRDDEDGQRSENDRGQTSIADSVVTKVAGLAAGEVPGVYELGSGAARAIGNVTQKVGFGDTRTQGVSVEVGEREAAVDLTIVVEYGESIPQVAEQVRQQIIKRVEGITGLSVVEVNINVDDLHFPGDDEPSEDARVA